jgi:CRISPR-associated protein Cas2
MLLWVIYDITDDKPRNTIARVLKGYGLYRVQKSAFLGEVNKNELDEIIIQAKELVDEATDSVYIFPMCERDFKRVRLIGQAFDKKLVSGELLSRFF